MSQKQLPEKSAEIEQLDPIKYGDVFNVQGELASRPIAPRDAAAMQAAENMVIGKTLKGGSAAVMESAAALNERLGLSGHNNASNLGREEGVTVSQKTRHGSRVVTEAIGGQAVVGSGTPGAVLDKDSVNIGEALEAAALSMGDKTVDQSDASAIQAAEMRATGRNLTQPGGIGALAHEKLERDKCVTREDAERVIDAEIRNKPDLNITPTPPGIGASMAAAATLNQNK
ncbi:hypothetical protein F8388_009648 [Cannabis sativa]|uniref:SMP domain-containing protein n=1 Tax=Cannabis sativa TaxID=3483 RepID=A0A7J6E8A2_CANSA|nr:hypothetical protein F8388_009648 [Cannabis sativa]